MRSASLAALTAIALSSSASAAEPPYPDFCADLSRFVEAAYERPAFASLVASPREIPRRSWECRFSGDGDDRRLNCEWHMAPSTDFWERLTAAIPTCYPRALRMARAEGDEPHAVFRFDVIVIETAHRNIHFRGGSYVSLSVFRVPVH